MNSWKQNCSQKSCKFQIPSFTHGSGSLDYRPLILALPAGFCKTQHDSGDKKQEPKEVSGKHIRGGGNKKKPQQNRRDKKSNGAESVRQMVAGENITEKKSPPTHTHQSRNYGGQSRLLETDFSILMLSYKEKHKHYMVKAWKKIALCVWIWMKTGWLTSRNTHSVIMGCCIAMATHLLMC